MPDSFVTGVDFIALQTRDHAAAAKFYGETLGLPFVKTWGSMPASEFQAGNLTLAVMQSDAFGLEFAPSSSMVALAVDDVAAVRERLEGEGILFGAISWTPASATRRSSPTRMAGNLLALHHRYAPKDATPG